MVQSLPFRRTTPNALNLLGDDEAATELDEPPDDEIEFSKKLGSRDESSVDETGSPTSMHLRKPSLLTQALMSSPELNAVSDAETPNLVSDGGLTSPAGTTTPSPPLPSAKYIHFPPLEAKAVLSPNSTQRTEPEPCRQAGRNDATQETKIEETLGRRRCISFACGKNTRDVGDRAYLADPPQPPPQPESNPVAPPPRRPCMLRFACPTKPLRTKPAPTEAPRILSPVSKPYIHPKCSRNPQCNFEPSLPAKAGSINPNGSSASQRLPKVGVEVSLDRNGDSSAKGPSKSPNLKCFNRLDFQKSHATSFHEFTGASCPEDEWTNEQTAYRHKMTVGDTLQKEYAIRRLAEEAEEEAEEEDSNMRHGNEEIDVGICDSDELDGSINDGNETDDEEGFAASEDESEDGSGYQFWTPSLTTAATSMDHAEHIRPKGELIASESSIDSVATSDNTCDQNTITRNGGKRHPNSKELPLRPRGSDSKVEPFIIGTLDEDRPLQEALMSSVERRKLSRQKLIPQDIDPSFPTSDPEAEDEGNASDTEYTEDGAKSLNEQHSTRSDSDTSENKGRRTSKESTERRKKRSLSPHKRLMSPPPRRLLGHSIHRLRSPPPSHKKIDSPPSSRRMTPQDTSPSGNLEITGVPRLGQRPNLTHTASLPRFPNPFWAQQAKGESRYVATPLEGTSPTTRYGPEDLHKRGPIDIVQGLENKRQRRKEKFWRIHCQKAHAGKERERKCQPGKGAERMREVGKEMQDRFKGYGHNRPHLVLSI